jgi:hypothetical protein
MFVGDKSSLKNILEAEHKSVIFLQKDCSLCPHQKWWPNASGEVNLLEYLCHIPPLVDLRILADGPGPTLPHSDQLEAFYEVAPAYTDMG